jgi:hypothetical protein
MSAFYLLGGLVIEARCDGPEVAGHLESRFGSLRTEKPSVTGGPGPDVVIEIRGPTADRIWPAAPPGGLRTVYDAPGGPIGYSDASDQIFVDYGGRVRLLCTPARGLIEMAFTGAAPDDPVLAAYPLLTLALVETMKRFGRFPLHAAGLSLHGRGVLVPGASGAGKSTTTVALVRAGFSFLSDDTVFLTGSEEGIWVAGFPDEIDVTDTTVAMVPELAYLAGAPIRPGREKHSFRVEDVFGVTPLAGCRPEFLVAPEVVGGARSELEELAPSDALVALLPNVLLTEPAASQAHLDMLARLVRSVRCLRLRVGSDLDAAAACVTDLVS